MEKPVFNSTSSPSADKNTFWSSHRPPITDITMMLVPRLASSRLRLMTNPVGAAAMDRMSWETSCSLTA
ncbi:hypothetical protein IEQ34_016826 [Dendrobium chrysotoxum]|uniref:Uncharacterized protein n=1 Tax=Dendrobium chrysotoxum TaxID=161865 RepID=A0AAV7GFB5_DENCH|nr:hypothetical protein IEQ34_016826 [Dendrobium chrysotoxum]